MQFDGLDGFQFEAESHRWRLRFVKTLDVRSRKAVNFLMWLMPKLGVHAVVDGEIYEGCRSGCRLDIGIHFTPCCGESEETGDGEVSG